MTGAAADRGEMIRAAAGPDGTTGPVPVGRWILTLYVDGASASSLRAIENIRQLCDQELNGQVDLEIIDVRRKPALAVRDQVAATPTLVKRLPEPLRRIVGDLSDPNRLRVGLDLGPVPGQRRSRGPVAP